jgi:Fe-S cluster assembly iron-binding protein IscA
MLTLTEAAGDLLTKILDDRNCQDEISVRFVCQDTEVSLALDNEKQGDSTFEHQGRTVLLLDPNAADYLGTKILGVKKTKKGVNKLIFNKQEPDSV